MIQSGDTKVAVEVPIPDQRKAKDNLNLSHDESSVTLPILLQVTPMTKMLTYARLALFPLFLVMFIFGFMYRNDCPADPRLIHYLFFCGLSGIISTALRFLIICTWRMIRSQFHEHYNALKYPGFQMVSCFSTMFFSLVFTWNMFATYNIIYMNPSFVDPSSTNYCEYTTYFVTCVSVIILNSFLAIGVLMWLVAIISILCAPKMFEDYFYEENILPLDIHFRIPIWLRDTEVIPELRKKLKKVSFDEAKLSNTKFNVTVTVNGDIYVTPESPDKDVLIKIRPE